MRWIWENCWVSAVLICMLVQSALGGPPVQATKVSDLICTRPPMMGFFTEDGVYGEGAGGGGRARASGGHFALLNNQLGWLYLLRTGALLVWGLSLLEEIGGWLDLRCLRLLGSLPKLQQSCTGLLGETSSMIKTSLGDGLLGQLVGGSGWSLFFFKRRSPETVGGC